MSPFRALRRLLAAAAMALPCSVPAAGTAVPGPVKILVGFPAGGTIDVVARLVAEQMQEDLAVPVVVETLAGAGGQLAAQALKRAAPDGRTLMIAPDHTAVIVPLTVARPGFDSRTDFAPVGMVADYAGALAVSQASAVKDLPDLMRYVQAHPGSGGVGVSAPGSKPQFPLDALAKARNLPLAAVPYRGSVPMVQDLAGGHIVAGITALGDFLEFHRAGKLRVVAVTGERRSSLLPEVPTAAESGYPLRLDFWVGMFAPAGTPPPVVERFNASLNKALAAAKVRERMAAVVFDPRPGPPSALQRRIASELDQWAPVIAASGWVRQ